MQITLKHTPHDQIFSATNGQTEILLGSNKSDGVPPAFSPMEGLLASLAGCMSIDIMMILNKQRQQVDHYEVKVTGTRADAAPAVFTAIQMEVHISGKVKEAKLQQAIRLSEEKYCSVYHMLAPGVDISTVYLIK